ncbi:MAG: NADH-quinone oxidoreductase subunit N [Nitrospirota bacterium]
MPTISSADLAAISPEIIVICSAAAVLILGLFVKKEWRFLLGYLSVAGIAVAADRTWAMRTIVHSAFSGMFVLDGYATYFKVVFYIAAAIALLISISYVRTEKVENGEYYSLILFATAGMMIMASGSDLMSIYLGLELMALSLYVLAGFLRKSLRSNEAALKYFLLGAFSSGILLYGIALIYGITGTTNLHDIAAFIQTGVYSKPALILSMILILSGFGFKIAAVPFHMWTPDVYEGAPTSVTAFMSVGPKAAAFAAFLRVFVTAFPGIQADWTIIIAALAILSMLIGNVVAISQTNIKRMLAYSSIAHAGYAMVGFAAGGKEGISSVMTYLLIYAFMNLGAFGMVVALSRGGMTGERIEDFAGLSKKNKMAALLMLIFMFSLAGIPPTAGFIGKFNIFMAALDHGFLWLALIMVAMSAVSAFFYLRVVLVMYMKEPEEDRKLTPNLSMYTAMAVAAYAVLYIGMNPAGVLNFALKSVSGLM